MQGQKAVFLKKKFADSSSVVMQYTKHINSIRDHIKEDLELTVDKDDLEIGQGI